MSDGQVLEFSGVTKQYGKVTAVSDFSARVEPGRITGFLGPNGAGKTTTLRILLGLANATSGTATIGGSAYRDLKNPLQTIGGALEANTFHPGRTAANHLKVYAVAGHVALSRIDEVLGQVGLADAAGRKVGGFSLGMRQRLTLATALLGDPGVLVLDEPSNGLDPEGIKWMRSFLRDRAREGRTVFVSSHMLSEVQQMADSIIIIAQGKKVFDGDFGDLISIDATDTVVVDSPDRGSLARALREAGLHADVLRSGLTVRGATTAEIGTAAAAAGVTLSALGKRGPSLEEIFLDLVSGARVQEIPVAEPVAEAETEAAEPVAAVAADAEVAAETETGADVVAEADGDENTDAGATDAGATDAGEDVADVNAAAVAGVGGALAAGALAADAAEADADGVTDAAEAAADDVDAHDAESATDQSETTDGDTSDNDPDDSGDDADESDDNDDASDDESDNNDNDSDDESDNNDNDSDDEPEDASDKDESDDDESDDEADNASDSDDADDDAADDSDEDESSEAEPNPASAWVAAAEAIDAESNTAAETDDADAVIDEADTSDEVAAADEEAEATDADSDEETTESFDDLLQGDEAAHDTFSEPAHAATDDDEDDEPVSAWAPILSPWAPRTEPITVADAEAVAEAEDVTAADASDADADADAPVDDDVEAAPVDPSAAEAIAEAIDPESWTTENPFVGLLEHEGVTEIPVSRDPDEDPDAFVDEAPADTVATSIITVSAAEPRTFTASIPVFTAPDVEADTDTDAPAPESDEEAATDLSGFDDHGGWERRTDRTPADEAADEFFRPVGLNHAPNSESAESDSATSQEGGTAG